ncbi:MAG TPA: small ribosomal subunit Rsm22 family protein [Dongiaceae bacterium]
MQLPPALREAIDRELDGVSLHDLARASETLSHRYRAELRDGRLHLDDRLAACAYLTTRLPATFAATAAALRAVIEARPDFAPRSMLDAGAGPGTATWAAAQCWSSLQDALLIEASPHIRAVGERLLRPLALDRAAWLSAMLDGSLRHLPQHDLVLVAYVLDELPPAARQPLIADLWQLAGDALVIVEPGTPNGWRRILEARDLLISAGAHLLAPCPHGRACPLAAPDWCHFSARVARSRLHREAKGGTVPWEDEKFIYLAASRSPGRQSGARIIAPPRVSKSAIGLKLCQPDGHQVECSFARRDDSFKVARRLDWGDTLPP